MPEIMPDKILKNMSNRMLEGMPDKIIECQKKYQIKY
jgi:hypothetical protein